MPSPGNRTGFWEITMVHLETVEELAESLADIGGIYGCGEGGDNGFADHPDTCNCRICFVSAITERIRQAVKNDIFLSNIKEMSKITNDPENKGDMPLDAFSDTA